MTQLSSAHCISKLVYYNLENLPYLNLVTLQYLMLQYLMSQYLIF